MDNHFDVIVVGAGIFGSTAAYHSQRLGKRTLLIEQFKVGHTNGSSHGKSRIIRYAHKDAEYIPLVKDAYKQIEELEKHRNEILWKKTGLLWLSTAEKIQQHSAVLKGFGAEHEVIKGNEINKRYPQFSFNDDVVGLIDPMGGVAYADKWITAFQDEFRKIGGVLKEGLEMKSFSDGTPVRLLTTCGEYTADKLIITVGSWIAKIVSNLPFKLQARLTPVYYWKTKSTDEKNLTNEMPVVISKLPGHGDIFALPAIDHDNFIKLCAGNGDPIIAGGDDPLNKVQSKIDKSVAQQYVSSFMPKFDSEPVLEEKCKYTHSEDNHYVLDFLPDSNNVILGACGSGSGFKVGPAVGRVLAELAVGMKPSINIDFFSVNRFRK